MVKTDATEPAGRGEPAGSIPDFKPRTSAALPSMAVRRGATQRFSGRRHVQGRDKTDDRRNLVVRQCLTTDRQDLALDDGRPAARAGAVGRRPQDDVRDHDGAGDEIPSRANQRCPHLRMAIDDRLDLLGMNLQAADIDDAAAPADEIAALAAALHEIAGIDKPVRVHEGRVFRADIAGCGSRRPDAERSIQHLDVDLAGACAVAACAHQARRESLASVIDLESDAGFRRRKGVDDIGSRIARVQTVQNRLVRDLSR